METGEELIDREEFEEYDLTGLFNEIVQRMDRLADCMVELHHRLEQVEEQYKSGE